MSYTTTSRLFAAGLISASILRIITKLFYIDLETGFLIQSQWALTLHLVIIAAIALSSIAASYKYKSKEPAPSAYHPFTMWMLAISGILIGVHGAIRYLYPSTVPNLIVIPTWLSYLELGLSAASCLALTYAAACLYKAKGYCLQAACATLVAVLWQSCWAVVRFSSFWQVTTVSDHLLESLFLVLSPLFWMSQAYLLSGIPKKNIGGRAITLGFTVAALSIPLAIGQIAALVAYNGQVTGPSLINCIMLLGIGAYAISFAISTSKFFKN